MKFKVGFGIWDGIWDLGFGMGFGVGMGMGFGIWDGMGWDWDLALMGIGILPFPTLWAASIILIGYFI
jgi:hypothetical protein